jgi:hypothetical protein
LVFKKNANFFAQNWRKSQKIVIITSVPDWSVGNRDFWGLGWRGANSRTIRKTVFRAGTNPIKLATA